MNNHEPELNGPGEVSMDSDRSSGNCSRISKSLPCLKRVVLSTLCFVHIIYASIWSYHLVAWGVNKVEKFFWISAQTFMLYVYVFGILVSFRPQKHLLTRLTLLVCLNLYYMFILGVLLKLNIESQLNHMKKLCIYMLYNLALICVVSLIKRDLSEPSSVSLEANQADERPIELPKTNGSDLSVEPYLRHIQLNPLVEVPLYRAEISTNNTSLRSVSASQTHRQEAML